MSELKYWHSIQLPNGEVTPGIKTLDGLQSEENVVFNLIDVRGKSVLDVGAWDGYFSFAAERRGARFVMASDWHCWVGPIWGDKACFDYAKKALNSKVEEWVCKAEELPENGPKFDKVLLLGVTYHVKNPIDLIKRCVNLANEHVIIETEYMNDGNIDPILKLIPDSSLNNDDTNWNIPNLEGVKVMMEMAGLTDVVLAKHLNFPNNRVFAVGSVKR